MPRKSSLTILAAGLLALVVVAGIACGGSGGENATPTGQASASPARQTPAGSKTPPPADGKTPIAGETPAGAASNTPPGGTPRATAPAGTLAVAPDDQAAFRAQFADKTIDFQDCQFDPATSGTDCGVHGLYRVDPVLTGQDISCQVGLVDDVPVIITCGSQQPLTTISYEIQQ